MKKYLLLLIFLISSCEIDGTKRLWSRNWSYRDYINSFLISEDGTTIVFVGEKYHYVLIDKSEIIKDLLTWNGRKKLIIHTSNFIAGFDNSIELEANISSVPTNFTNDESNFLRKVGFSEANKRFFKNIKLNGKRYLPRSGVDYNKFSSLSKKISIDVKYNSYGQVMLKTALTPLTVTSDTISLTADLSLYTLFLTLFITPQVVLYPVCVFGREGSCKNNPFVIKIK